ncbi:hypothetical protein BIW11_01935 [Tropilaelaps mercedesae]|uniref:GPR180/TMEM145 transmembrane domain-containing protein n=1 Tax=Tropilaelaps mercedesae TaxID=418985 RepID=A0A1V9X5P2_9ACAR|nr:hypothetical protein BIW11_01935 [Tropilaelaps mercedesae]
MKRKRSFYRPCQQLLTSLLVPLLLLSTNILSTDGLHLRGQFESREFFKLLAKFGFEKTDNHDHVNTLGYIYGNVTGRTSEPALIQWGSTPPNGSTAPASKGARGVGLSPHALANNTATTPGATLVVVEREHFFALWGNRTLLHDACTAMFSQLQRDAFDRQCNPNGTRDFLRTLPCLRGRLCVDEDTPSRVLKHSQFTYTVCDMHTPRFWYVTLVACYRDRRNCTWRSSADDHLTLDYDIYLVNGHPQDSTALDDEFSFEEQGSLQRTGIFFALYVFLLALHVHLQINKERHPLTRILFMAVLLQFVSHLATLVHIVLFAANGEGLPTMRVVGEIAYIFAQSFFIVLVLVISRGYAITRSEVSGKRLLVFLWLTYIVAHIVLYVWVNTEIDPIKEIDEFETYPGGLVLAVRMAIMLFMLRELHSTIHLENNGRKLRFYLHLTAGLLCWFIYLPILAVIASQVSTLWKRNLIHGIVACADFMAYAIVTHVLWPAESHDYLQLQAVFEEYDDYHRFGK